MKKLLIFTILTLSLFGEIYPCSGYGSTQSEAKEEAKKSAIASSSAYIKSIFQKDISNNQKDVRYTLQAIVTGICKIESGTIDIDGNKFHFSGVCRVENEAITKTEDILKRVEKLENREKAISTKILELQQRISKLPNHSDKVVNLQNQIAELETQILNLPKFTDIYYQIAQNYRVVNLQISNITNRLENRISDTTNRLENRISDTTNRLDSRISDTTNRLDSRISDTTNRLDSRISEFEKSYIEKIEEIERRYLTISQDLERLKSRVSLLEKYQNYIFFALALLGVAVIFLLFRRPKEITIEKIADISVVSKDIKISTEKKVYFKNETLTIKFANFVNKELYFYIIDINMRDETTLIYPSKFDNNLLPPNSKRELPGIEVVPPFGRDILKIIASPVPLKIPKIVYKKESRVFQDKRGFSNPNIENIEREISNNNSISDKDILAHFRGQALNGGFTLYENFTEVETKG